MDHKISDKNVFVLQVAVTKAAGGIETAIRHYARMLREVAVDALCVYRGSEAASLRSEFADVIEVGKALTSPLYRFYPEISTLTRTVNSRAAGRLLLVIIHSDRALPAIRWMFPDALIVTPCHSDKIASKRKADLVISLNPSQHRIVSASLKGTRATPAMLGNPYVSRKPQSFASAHLADGPGRIVFCARFTRTKDPLIVLRAAELLTCTPLPAFLFIGSGPLQGELIERAKSSQAKVSFAGWLSDPWAAFNNNDILVLPSSWEGLPYALQEALDHEIPIIGSDNAGNRQALGDGAYGELFRSGDAKSLAAAIEHAVSDPDALRAKARLGRAMLESRYGAKSFWDALQRSLGLLSGNTGRDNPPTVLPEQLVDT